MADEVVPKDLIRLRTAMVSLAGRGSRLAYRHKLGHQSFMPRLRQALIVRLPILALAIPSKHFLIGIVVKVTDADTITILTGDDVQERVRLWALMLPKPEATNLTGKDPRTN